MDLIEDLKRHWQKTFVLNNTGLSPQKQNVTETTLISFQLPYFDQSVKIFTTDSNQFLYFDQTFFDR